MCTDFPHPVGAAAYEAFAGGLAQRRPSGRGRRRQRVAAVRVLAGPGGPHARGWSPRAGSPTILVVGNTGDAATPFASAVAVAHHLDHSALLTYQGVGPHQPRPQRLRRRGRAPLPRRPPARRPPAPSACAELTHRRAFAGPEGVTVGSPPSQRRARGAGRSDGLQSRDRARGRRGRHPRPRGHRLPRPPPHLRPAHRAHAAARQPPARRRASRCTPSAPALARLGVGPGPPRPLPPQRQRVPRGHARRATRPGWRRSTSTTATWPRSCTTS